MEITKTKDEIGTYKVSLTEDTKQLTMYMAGNGDVYMEMTDGIKLKKDRHDWRFLDIKSEDEELFPIVKDFFAELYKNPKLQDINNSIVWISDDGKESEQDRFTINDYGEIYRLSFIRNNPIEKTKRKPSKSIVIRFATAESKYQDSIPAVMHMYHKLILLAKQPKELKK